MMEANPRGFLSLQNSTLRYHGLDTLRSVAILAVIGYHLLAFHGDTVPGWAAPLLRLGWMGVDLFFVLSGYLIASQLLRKYAAGSTPGLWDFYRNRLYRVLPGFFLVLGLYLVAPWFREAQTMAPAWQYATFTFNLLTEHPAGKNFSHAWSLCVEEHFYLFFPLIVWAAMRKPSLRRGVVLVAAFVLAGIAVRGWVLFHLLRPLADQDGFGVAFMRYLYYPTYSRLDGLLAGVSLAMLRTFRPAWWAWMARRGHTLLVLGVATISAAVWLFEGRFPAETGTSVASMLLGFPLLALGLACLVASALSANGWLRLRIPGAQTCATLAYCLYLTQKQMLHLTDAWFPGLAQAGRLPWVVGYLVVCLAAAAVLHLCVERPFLLLRERGRVVAGAPEAAIAAD